MQLIYSPYLIAGFIRRKQFVNKDYRNHESQSPLRNDDAYLLKDIFSIENNRARTLQKPNTV